MSIRLLAGAMAVAAVMYPCVETVAGAAAAATCSAGARGPSPVTAQNMTHAAHTEAAANLQYFGYASVLPASQAGVANVWRTVGRVEHEDHWMSEVKGLNLLDANPTNNLKVVISAYQQAIKDDRTFAARAPKGSAAASELRAVADRYSQNVALLQQALSALQGRGKVPAAPKVNSVAIKESAKPHYNGNFYTADLTGGANSALSDAAWNWALAESAARTAVDNGQAALGQLLSGLGDQERRQNWPSLSNMAGYVNGEADNLKESIASEKGAITMYDQFAAKANTAGDSSQSAAFTDFRKDEQGHLKAFTEEYNQVKH
jgi:rubrerythrin